MFATQNMWTFILLDSYNGRLWQVQYSTQDLDNLFCIPINKNELVENNEKVCILYSATNKYVSILSYKR